MDVEAVKERGLAMGLNPRRSSVTIGSRITRKWRRVLPCMVGMNDIVAGHGVVHESWMLRADDVVVAVWMETGIDYTATQFDPTVLVKAFTEVDMSYGKIDGKGATHITATSMTRDSLGDTYCGQTGTLVLVADDQVDKVCSKCTKVAEGMS